MASYSRQDKQRGSALVIILTLVAILATAGAIVYVLLSSNDKGGGVDLGKIGQKTTTASTSDGVKALLTKAKAGEYDAKCTYTSESGDGTLYVSGAEKMRVDTTINDRPGHVLRLGGAGYIWADGQSEGSKLPFQSGSSTDSKYSPETFASKVDKYHVRCESVGHLSESLFTLPKGVNFIDVNSQLQPYSSDQ